MVIPVPLSHSATSTTYSTTPLSIPNSYPTYQYYGTPQLPYSNPYSLCDIQLTHIRQFHQLHHMVIFRHQCDLWCIHLTQALKAVKTDKRVQIKFRIHEVQFFFLKKKYFTNLCQLVSNVKKSTIKLCWEKKICGKKLKSSLSVEKCRNAKFD